MFREPPDDIYSMIDRVVREGGDVLLFVAQTSQYMRYSNSLGPLGLKFGRTDSIDFMDGYAIAAKTWIGRE